MHPIDVRVLGLRSLFRGLGFRGGGKGFWGSRVSDPCQNSHGPFNFPLVPASTTPHPPPPPHRGDSPNSL